jgi:hypothetical protein
MLGLVWLFALTSILSFNDIVNITGGRCFIQSRGQIPITLRSDSLMIYRTKCGRNFIITAWLPTGEY